ncbi:MAG: hypothetical protein WCJ26_14325 [bacterium]
MKTIDTSKEDEILILLKEGHAYTAIEERLGVSSKTISKVKHDHFPLESMVSSLSGQITSKGITENNTDFSSIPNNGQQMHIPNKAKNNDMESELIKSYQAESRSEKEIDLEKYKAKLTFDLEMAKVENERRKEDFKNFIIEEGLALDKQGIALEREKIAATVLQITLDTEKVKNDLEIAKINATTIQANLKIKNDQFDAASAKGALQEKNHEIMAQFEKLVEKCQEGEWSYQEVTDYLVKVQKLRSKVDYANSYMKPIRDYFFELGTLDSIIAYWKEELANWGEDDVCDFTLNEDLLEAFSICQLS